MEIKISTKQMLKILYVISWILFIGISIEAGGFLSNTLFTFFVNPIAAQHFWKQIDFSSLYNFDSGYFLTIGILISIVAVLKAIMFYQIVKILYNKKINLVQPFNHEVKNFIFSISYLSLGIGLFSHWGIKYTEWLIKLGIHMPNIQQLSIAGADVWLFMSVILFIIAQIFKRGIEIQSENELTI